MSASSSQGAGYFGRTIFRRLFLLSASLTIGTVIWFLLGDTDSLVAEEKLFPAAHATTAPTPLPDVIAHVDGVAILQQDVLIEVQDQLAALDEERRKLLRSGLETRINRQLIATEAAVRGVDVDALLAEEVEAKLETVDPARLAARTSGEMPPEAVLEVRRQLRLQAFIAELRNAAAVSVYGEPAV
ncbi:MAG: hypothetical protein AAGF23_15620 [Acidobacteriota bacterium]